MLKVKRVYEEPAKEDGFRILVDRLWPRGMTKEKAKVDLWLKDIAPSDALRKWYQHDPEKWLEFEHRYFSELKDKKESLDLIQAKAKKGTVTLLFSSKEEKINNAQALKEYLEKR
ncbi:MAG TPA: DUF488 family protein [Terriglobales bacterium]|nr:DUF488 family protein [Terriglobales bacterium]